MPKGIPASGKRAAGGGRKPAGTPRLVRVTVALRPDQVAALRAAAKQGTRSASALVRDLLDEVMKAGAALGAKGIT